MDVVLKSLCVPDDELALILKKIGETGAEDLESLAFVLQESEDLIKEMFAEPHQYIWFLIVKTMCKNDLTRFSLRNDLMALNLKKKVDEKLVAKLQQHKIYCPEILITMVQVNEKWMQGKFNLVEQAVLKSSVTEMMQSEQKEAVTITTTTTTSVQPTSIVEPVPVTVSKPLFEYFGMNICIV